MVEAGVEFITNNGQKIGGEAIPMVVLVMDWVGEGNMGMVITFCHHDQAKVEASKVLSVLCQHNSLEPSVVVVRRFINSLYLPWGSFGFLYLDATTLSWGTLSTQFPLDWLLLCRLLPYSDTEVVLPWEEGEEGLKVYPFFPKTLWKSSKEEHCLSDPILLLVPLSPPTHQEESSQTKEGSGIHPALKWLQDISQAKVQLRRKLAHEVEELTRKYEDQWIRLARKHEKQWAKMAEEADASFQEVLSQDKLNWLSQAAALVHSLCSSHLLCEWSAGHHCMTERGHPSNDQKEQDHYSSGAIGDQCNKQTCVNSQEVEGRSEHSSTKGDEDMLEVAQEARPSSKLQGQEPTSPPSSPVKAMTDPGDGTLVGTLRTTRD